MCPRAAREMLERHFDGGQSTNKNQALARRATTESSTHDAKRPIYRAIQPAPTLLCKPRDGMLPLLPGLCIFSLLSLDPRRAWKTYSHKGREDTLHGRLPEHSECQRPEDHEAGISRALVVQCLRRRMGERVCDGIRQGHKGPQGLWDIGVEEGRDGGGGEVARHAGALWCGVRCRGERAVSPRSQLVGVWQTCVLRRRRWFLEEEKDWYAAVMDRGIDGPARNLIYASICSRKAYYNPSHWPLRYSDDATTSFLIAITNPSANRAPT